MLGLAAIIALCVALGAGVLDLVSSSRDDDFLSTIVATIVSFLFIMLVNWGLFYSTSVVFAGAGWWWLAFLDAVIVLICFGVANGVTERVGGTVVFVVLALIFGNIGIFGFYNNWPLGNLSNKLGHIAQVDIHKNVNDYPPTDDNHMVIVSHQNALYKANLAMGQDLTGTSTTIGSRYKLDNCNLQSVDVHMYWLCGLKFSGNHNGYVLPGYIVVDAEDPLSEPQAKLSYKMRYTTIAPGSHSIDRLIWNKYNDYYVDDLTLEVNDQWQPFYTAALSRPVVRMQQSIPVAAITVDPQTGVITRYNLNNVPTWVDRIYTASMAKTMLNWWGEWAVKSWTKQGTSGRYDVDGQVDLVYTSHGPAWQALMSSQNSDTSVNYIALMDTRSTHVDMYVATDITTQQLVKKDLANTNTTKKSYDAASMAIHKVYGELTWVMPLVPQGTGNDEAMSFSGLALLRANDSNSADVIYGTDKGDAFSQYANQLAAGDDNASPGSESHTTTVSGVIARASLITSNNKSFEVIMLAGDAADIFTGEIKPADIKSLQMSLAKAGDKVTLTYAKNSGSKVKVVTSYTLNP